LKDISKNSEIKLLLVDDREDNLTSMEIVLEKEGYSFSKAISGKEALKILLKEDDFSLILLDVMMPIMDGYETAELIYQREKLRHIPIIFITAHDFEETNIFRGYKAGAVDYIRKPFNPELLKSKVAVFAELHKKNQQLSRQEEKLREINSELLELNFDLEKRVKDRTEELEKLNNELKQLNLSKDKFLSVISHDLRNPLSALLASSEQLNSNINQLNNAQIQQFSSIIYRTSNKVLTQLNELVEWAKQQREKENFNPHKIQLFSGVNDSLDLLRTNAIQKKVKLENNIAKEIYVKADLLMLRSIIQNLVTNAIKFTNDGGLVILSARKLETMVEVSVKDNGIGIDERTKENLFKNIDPIAANGIKNEGPNGLGLFLVRDFIAQHGGAIQIESEIGKGSTFKFTLPTEV
jgi:two-component system, sensor histidine kinase and response regulator